MEVGKLYVSDNNIIILCTGPGINDRVFEGVVVNCSSFIESITHQKNKTSDHHLGSYSKTWSKMSFNKEYEGDVIINNEYWSPYIPICDCVDGC